MQDNWGDLIKQLWWEINPQSNYHGSGAIFDRFDKSFRLTGQGANAHGYGWYSADDPMVGARYVIQKNKPITFNNYPNITITELNNAYNNGIDLKPKSKYLYNVNVPNLNYMLDVKKPMDHQSSYIIARLKNIYESSDIPVTTKESWKYLDNSDTKYLYRFLAEDLAEEIYPESRWFDENYRIKLGSPHASDIFEKYGIKGIRTFGQQDGPINIVFADKDIKIANTPFQRFANRIPTQTLGKIAEKIMSNPVVKVGGGALERATIPLSIYEGISQPTATDQQMWDDVNRYNLQRGVNLLHGGISNGR